MNQNRPTVPEVYPLIIDYYKKPDNNCGGSLHCVLDDGNLDDQNIIFSIGHAHEESDEDGVRLGELLLRMSITQRRKLYNLPHRTSDYGFSDPRTQSS